MIEVQVYEGTENSPKYLLPNQVEDFGRSLMAFAKQAMIFGAKAKDPTARKDLTRYSGHLMAVGLTLRKGVWVESDMNNLPLMLGQVAGYAYRFGFPEIYKASEMLLYNHKMINDIKREQP